MYAGLPRRAISLAPRSFRVPRVQRALAHGDASIVRRLIARSGIAAQDVNDLREYNVCVISLTNLYEASKRMFRVRHVSQGMSSRQKLCRQAGPVRSGGQIISPP